MFQSELALDYFYNLVKCDTWVPSYFNVIENLECHFYYDLVGIDAGKNYVVVTEFLILSYDNL